MFKGEALAAALCAQDREVARTRKSSERWTDRPLFRYESHICTEGYVPYGWQFRNEDIYIPSQRGYRLNIFGMIDCNNRYEGFSTDESVTGGKVADFLGRLSMRIKKDTFVVLDNASVHRGKLMTELRPIWEKRRPFLFFLPRILRT